MLTKATYKMSTLTIPYKAFMQVFTIHGCERVSEQRCTLCVQSDWSISGVHTTLHIYLVSLLHLLDCPRFRRH